MFEPALAVRQEAFEARGTSYPYRLELGFYNLRAPLECADRHGKVRGDSDVIVFVDASPLWHGTREDQSTGTKKNTHAVHADGHARRITSIGQDGFLDNWTDPCGRPRP